MKQEKLERWRVNIFAIAGAVLFVTFLIKFGNIYYQLTFHRGATYAVVDSIYLETGRTRTVAYSFKVDGKKYNGTAYYDEKVRPATGDSFEVVYSTLDPTISRLQMPE